MANNWDETQPSNSTTAARDIDDEIRSFKARVRERLAQITNFPGDSNAVIWMLAGSARIGVGTEAARPSPTHVNGQLYWAHDTNRLFVSILNEDSQLEWDAEPLFEPTKIQHAVYNDQLAPGTKITAEEVTDKQLSMFVTGQVAHETVAGRVDAVIYVDLNELEEDYDVERLLTLTIGTAAAPTSSPRSRACVGYTPIEGNRIRFTFLDLSSPDVGSATDLGTTVQFSFHATFSTTPQMTGGAL